MVLQPMFFLISHMISTSLISYRQLIPNNNSFIHIPFQTSIKIIASLIQSYMSYENFHYFTERLTCVFFSKEVYFKNMLQFVNYLGEWEENSMLASTYQQLKISLQRKGISVQIFNLNNPTFFLNQSIIYNDLYSTFSPRALKQLNVKDSIHATD